MLATGSVVLVLRLVVCLGMAASVLFWLACLYSAREFFSTRRRQVRDGAKEWLPPVTVLKPLKGKDPELLQNLSSFCAQEYPQFQIVFGVADAGDPAVAVVEEVRRRHPAVDIDLVVDARVHGTNYKVSNLINMDSRAKHEILVLSDSDIRVGPDYLRRVVAPLRDKGVGLVTCLYRAVPAGGLPSMLEALFVNTDFCHQILVARKIEKPTYAFGATIALRRSVLERAGGFGALADMLADDYVLGHRIAARGLRLCLSNCMVATVVDSGSWKRLLRHQMRWARTYRNCRPGGYAGMAFTHGVLWAALNLILGASGTASAFVSLAVVGARVATAAAASWLYLGTRLQAPALLLMLVKDILLALVWARSLFGRSVWWSDRQFRVLGSGKMELVATEVDRTPAAIRPRATGAGLLRPGAS